jgi:hypothetical protein
MGNLNKKLKGLFHDYLERIEYEKSHPKVVNHSYNPPSNDFGFHGVIYFYEWSDLNRAPRTFYTIEKFENFLIECDLSLQGFEKEVIKMLHNPYICCKKNSRELLIRNSYDNLRIGLNDSMFNDSKSKEPINSVNNGINPFYKPNKGSEDRIPYNVACTFPPIKRPHIIEEFESRDTYGLGCGWFG